jgi:hypothetical protein
LISLTFIALVVLRYGYHYFSVDQSVIINWLQNLIFRTS